MIDLHSHILPGIDDGSPNMESSLAMAKMAVKDGIRTIIATPHFTHNCTRSSLEEAVAALQEAVTAADIDLTILVGAEIPSQLALAVAWEFCLADSSFLLLEFPHNHLPADSSLVIAKLLENGITPIIAHPERNRAIFHDPLKLASLIAAGAQAQVTAESLTGELGVSIRNCAEYLLRQNMVHYLATDSHSPAFRKPLLSKAVKHAARIIGKEQAMKLVHDHPAVVVQS